MSRCLCVGVFGFGHRNCWTPGKSRGALGSLTKLLTAQLCAICVCVARARPWWLWRHAPSRHMLLHFMLHHARNLVCAHVNVHADGAGQHAPPPVMPVHPRPCAARPDALPLHGIVETQQTGAITWQPTVQAHSCLSVSEVAQRRSTCLGSETS